MTPAYAATLEYLYAQLPMFSRIGSAALKPDLKNALALCAGLGQPQDKFPSIHIAGTNGKGSTSHALAAVLQHAGYRTGLYTSPHLIDFRERIRINGVPVTEDWVVNFVDQQRSLIEGIKPSFFEITVAMAFAAFAEAGVDAAVVETGLGGRLDSTNVITPVLSIITNIGLDHTDLLGNTIGEIAREKAGIIKPSVPVVIGQQQEETERVFSEAALRNRSPLYYADSLWSLVRTEATPSRQKFKAVHLASGRLCPLYTDLAGRYQQHNIATVLAATDLLSGLGWHVGVEKALNALANVRQTTGLRGRWEVLQTSPLIVADVAHNTDGLGEVLSQWEGIAGGTKHIVAGFVRDKDVNAALALFPQNATYHFCNAAIPRALPAEELYERARDIHLNGFVYPSVSEAVAGAIALMNNEDALLITGSFFVVGEALERYKTSNVVSDTL